MSSVYITEPPTRGKVLLHTSAGDVDVELWPKEAPLACRNFVQLALEGGYDGCDFHRIIKGLMVQTGDPTGTGRGGESVFGAPFNDEFHSRLKFSHRGLLAMANDNVPNSNRAQFFLTLDKASWLDKKHTIFGKVTGNTIFNLLRIGEAETDPKTDRPIDAPRLLSVEVLDNPFDDVVPRGGGGARGTAHAKPPPQPQQRRHMGGKAATNLLSFGEEEEEAGDGGAPRAIGDARPRAVMAAAHEVADDEDRALLERAESARAAGAVSQPPPHVTHAAGSAGARNGGIGGGSASTTALGTGVAETASDFAAAMRASVRMKRPRAPEEDARKISEDNGSGNYDDDVDESDAAALSRRKSGGGPSEYDRLRDELRAMRESRATSSAPAVQLSASSSSSAAGADAGLLTPLQQLRAKYKARSKTTGAREGATLDKLAAFTANLRKAPGPSAPSSSAPAYSGQVLEDDDGEDNEVGEEAGDGGGGGTRGAAWMHHKLKFKRHVDDAFRDGSGLTVTVSEGAGEDGAEGRARGGGAPSVAALGGKR